MQPQSLKFEINYHYWFLRDINEKFGTTFIIITHDRRIAEKADSIIEIADGKINIDINK